MAPSAQRPRRATPSRTLPAGLGWPNSVGTQRHRLGSATGHELARGYWRFPADDADLLRRSQTRRCHWLCLSLAQQAPYQGRFLPHRVSRFGLPVAAQPSGV